MNLIDVDELELRKFTAAGSMSEYGRGWNGALAAVVENAPTIEAEPVRHAKWRKSQVPVTKTHEFCCSACATYVSVFATNCYYKYCPNCGARMDGGS